jgi:hypothetical protein
VQCGVCIHRENMPELESILQKQILKDHCEVNMSDHQPK